MLNSKNITHFELPPIASYSVSSLRERLSKQRETRVSVCQGFEIAAEQTA